MDTVTVTAARSAATADPAADGLHRVVNLLFGEDGFNFKDVLDLVNPLQHIPVIGNIYRNLTGDELSPAIRLAGGTLFGGPLGAAMSAVGLIVERARGQGADAATPDTPNDAATAIAETPAAAIPRGGWMIAAATTGTVPAFVPARVAGPGGEVVASTALPAPRGGWMIAAAGALRRLDAPTVVTVPVAAGASSPLRELKLPPRRDTAVLPAPPALPLAAHDAASTRVAALFASLQAQDASSSRRLLGRA